MRTRKYIRRGGLIGCSRFAGYIKATAALCLVSLFTDAVATILTGLGLRTQNHNMKYKYYRYAVLVMALSCKLSGYGKKNNMEKSSILWELIVFSNCSDRSVDCTDFVSGLLCI